LEIFIFHTFPYLYNTKTKTTMLLHLIQVDAVNKMFPHIKNAGLAVYNVSGETKCYIVEDISNLLSLVQRNELLATVTSILIEKVHVLA